MFGRARKACFTNLVLMSCIPDNLETFICFVNLTICSSVTFPVVNSSYSYSVLPPHAHYCVQFKFQVSSR